jgi:histidinol phosphatase-like enzyme
MIRTAELLTLPVTEIVYCPHPSKPVGCFCRKPMPGLGVYLMQRHLLSREHLVMVGDMDTDAECAAAFGATYFDAEEFFGTTAPVPEVG